MEKSISEYGERKQAWGLGGFKVEIQPVQKKEDIPEIFSTAYSAHTYIAKELSVALYLTRPYCSKDRAEKENTHGLLRQSFPKRLVLIQFLKSSYKGLFKI